MSCSALVGGHAGVTQRNTAGCYVTLHSRVKCCKISACMPCAFAAVWQNTAWLMLAMAAISWHCSLYFRFLSSCLFAWHGQQPPRGQDFSGPHCIRVLKGIPCQAMLLRRCRLCHVFCVTAWHVWAPPSSAGVRVWCHV